MKPTSIFFHNGYKFDISPMVIKSVTCDNNSIRMVVDNITETGSCVIPCSVIVNGEVMTLNLLNGDTIRVKGNKAQYGGDGK